jgi:phosphoglycolate phosphatase-like HAD superfamily hydrolase
MITNILWDFDGVILDSMKVKGDAFTELFSEYDKSLVSQFEVYHYTNGGMSRYEKVRYFYTELLHQSITENEVASLCNKFSEILQKKLFDKKLLIKDSVDFIKENYQKFNFHIVSASEDRELKELCSYLEITHYFHSIHGSPTKKSILIKNIINQYQYKLLETILIGDSINDLKAATENSIAFYGYNNDILKGEYYIESFKKGSF